MMVFVWNFVLRFVVGHSSFIDCLSCSNKYFKTIKIKNQTLCDIVSEGSKEVTANIWINPGQVKRGFTYFSVFYFIFKTTNLD